MLYNSESWTESKNPCSLHGSSRNLVSTVWIYIIFSITNSEWFHFCIYNLKVDVIAMFVRNCLNEKMYLSLWSGSILNSAETKYIFDTTAMLLPYYSENTTVPEAVARPCDKTEMIHWRCSPSRMRRSNVNHYALLVHRFLSLSPIVCGRELKACSCGLACGGTTFIPSFIKIRYVNTFGRIHRSGNISVMCRVQ
jgi:hypothetical protein